MRAIYKKITLILLVLLFHLYGKTQNIDWKIGLTGFADNREYDSKVQIPQSILGLQFVPELGLKFDSLHGIYGGANILKEFGSHETIDKVYPHIYYTFQGKLFNFRFGSFPRHPFFTNCPAVLYYDSLNYYRPYINGLFWTYTNGNFTQSVYLDWTSRQTNVYRETFIMGGQGKYQNNMLFVRNYLYMYHFAGPAIPLPNDHVRDNGVTFIGVGADLSQKLFFDSLSFSVSNITSYERTRDIEEWHTPTGIYIEAIIEYKGWGISNILYSGQGHKLDWGDPYYRLKQYNRLNLYYSLLNFKRVTGRFGISMHFAEGKISHQQQFLLRVNIGKE